MEIPNDKDGTEKAMQAAPQLNRALIVQYFLYHTRSLPAEYIEADCNRITILYFTLIALDMLKKLHVVNNSEMIDFVYSLQLVATPVSIEKGIFGFIGGTFLMTENVNEIGNGYEYYVQGHLAMIYTALACLITLEDDLIRVDQLAFQHGLQRLQLPNGSFLSCLHGGEADVRFVYCACAIAEMLDIWSAIDQSKAIEYILACMTYEGGFGLRPGDEAQGGATYCALAALSLMKQLDSALTSCQRDTCISWCERRQNIGFEGRTGKSPDSCYSYWIGASLSMLGVFADSNQPVVETFLLSSCQSIRYGGFSKQPDGYPDVMHSFYSLAWLSLVHGDDGEKNSNDGHDFNRLNITLAICQDKLEIWKTKRKRIQKDVI